VASLSQGRTAAAQCGLFTYKSVPVIFEPPCIFENSTQNHSSTPRHSRFTHSTVFLWQNHTQTEPTNHKERIQNM